MGSYLLFAAVIAVCALLWWAAYKLEPHWVSKDGDRLVCYGQPMTTRGETQGRWRELKVTKANSTTVEIRVRRGSLVADRYSSLNTGMSGFSSLARDVVKRHGRKPSYWRVIGQSPSAPRGKVIYLLNHCNDPLLPEMIALRIPAHSKAIPMLESVSVNRQADGSSSPSPQPRETPQSEAQPDRD